MFQCYCYIEPQGENVVCVKAVPNGCCPILTVGTASMDLFPFVAIEVYRSTKHLSLHFLCYTVQPTLPFLNVFNEMTLSNRTGVLSLRTV